MHAAPIASSAISTPRRCRVPLPSNKLTGPGSVVGVGAGSERWMFGTAAVHTMNGQGGEAVPEYDVNEHLLVNISAGIVPGVAGAPDWQTGTITERLENGYYRVRLDQPVAGREAVKDAAPEHVRPLRSG